MERVLSIHSAYIQHILVPAGDLEARRELVRHQTAHDRAPESKIKTAKVRFFTEKSKIICTCQNIFVILHAFSRGSNKESRLKAKILTL